MGFLSGKWTVDAREPPSLARPGSPGFRRVAIRYDLASPLSRDAPFRGCGNLEALFLFNTACAATGEGVVPGMLEASEVGAHRRVGDLQVPLASGGDAGLAEPTSRNREG
jgi:hypothetical protein